MRRRTRPRAGPAPGRGRHDDHAAAAAGGRVLQDPGVPPRIRVLELLSEREHAVAEMLPQVGVEPAHLSQQLAVLRRADLVVARKEGSTVHYSLTSPHVAELLRVARAIRSGVLAGQAELLAGLRDETSPLP